LLKNKLTNVFIFDRIGRNVVPYFLYTTKIMNANPLDPSYSALDFVKDLSSKEPTTIN
jgi:hypothetical protein